MTPWRELSEDEITRFAQWARDNYRPGETINPLWHPVTRAECDAINDESDTRRNDAQRNER